MSMDQRILGCGNVSKEVFSLEEFELGEFQLSPRPRYHRLHPQHHDTSNKIKNWQIRHFCNNWLHTVKIGRQVIGNDAWNHICIGSDFDGLIDPVDDFKSAADYKFVFGRLVEWMPVVAQAMDIPLPAQDVQDKVRGLVFENALEFLSEYYV